MRKSGALLLICLVVLTGSWSLKAEASREENRQSSGLSLVSQDGKFGFINSEGKVVIPPQFDDARGFSEGLAAVRVVGRKWGFIDTKGELLIPTQFDWVQSFSEGLAHVTVDTKQAFIDQTGKIVGHVTVDTKQAFIDQTGKIVFEVDSQTALHDFSEGLVSFRIPEFKFLAQQDDHATPHRGTAIGGIGDKWGFMDTAGKVVIPPQFEEAGSFSEGLASVRVGHKVGFINKAGVLAIPAQFYWQLSSFSEGLAFVLIGDERGFKGGFIDKTGKLVIAPQFALASNCVGAGDPSFSNGLAHVRLNEKEGFINQTGEWIIPPRFDAACPFHEGLACVEVDRNKAGAGKWGFIDRTGRFVVSPRFDLAGGFSGGLAEAMSCSMFGYYERSGYINKQGRYVWSRLIPRSKLR